MPATRFPNRKAAATQTIPRWTTTTLAPSTTPAYINWLTSKDGS